VGKIAIELNNTTLYIKKGQLHTGFQFVEEFIVIPLGINHKTNKRIQKIPTINILILAVIIDMDFSIMRTVNNKKAKDKQYTKYVIKCKVRTISSLYINA
jgi:hypothetical protein